MNKREIVRRMRACETEGVNYPHASENASKIIANFIALRMEIEEDLA